MAVSNSTGTEHSTAQPTSLLEGMTDTEINAMPMDEFCDALYTQMEGKGPLLTCEQIDAIEVAWEQERRNRRAALVLLTKPWAWLNQQVTNDREFAVAVAQIKECAERVELYKGLDELMKTASTWVMMTLASREDMIEVLSEADAELGG